MYVTCMLELARRACTITHTHTKPWCAELVLAMEKIRCSDGVKQVWPWGHAKTPLLATSARSQSHHLIPTSCLDAFWRSHHYITVHFFKMFSLWHSRTLHDFIRFSSSQLQSTGHCCCITCFQSWRMSFLLATMSTWLSWCALFISFSEAGSHSPASRKLRLCSTSSIPNFRNCMVSCETSVTAKAV